MRARKWILVIVIVLAAIATARALGVWAGSFFSSPQPNTPPPALVFSDDDLTFGPIPESESVERELRLTNTSAEPVTVERFEKSCTCLGIEPTGGFTVPAGGTTVLKIKLKSAIPAGAKLSADGLFSESVNLSAVGAAPAGVPPRFSAAVRFTIHQTIQFDPPAVQLGIQSHREPVSVKATLTLLPPIKDVRVLPHPFWTVTVTTKGEGVREITATPTKPGEVGVVNDPLQVIPVGTDGEDRPARTLLIRGEIKSDIVASPADISLGRVKMGTTVEESFRLTSLTGRKFEVVRTAAETADDTITPDATDRTQFGVRVRATAAGGQVRWLTVAVRQDDGQACEVRVPVRYFGE